MQGLMTEVIWLIRNGANCLGLTQKNKKLLDRTN